MKLWKLVLGVSLVVNILFLLREIREKRMLDEADLMLDEATLAIEQGNASLDKLHTNFEKFNQDLRDQHLGMVASNDQLEAFIEEHTKNVR